MFNPNDLGEVREFIDYTLPTAIRNEDYKLTLKLSKLNSPDYKRSCFSNMDVAVNRYTHILAPCNFVCEYEAVYKGDTTWLFAVEVNLAGELKGMEDITVYKEYTKLLKRKIDYYSTVDYKINKEVDEYIDEYFDKLRDEFLLEYSNGEYSDIFKRLVTISLPKVKRI